MRMLYKDLQMICDQCIDFENVDCLMPKVIRQVRQSITVKQQVYFLSNLGRITKYLKLNLLFLKY